MKILQLQAIALLAFLLCSCQSTPEQNAYRVIGATAVSVHGTMQGWGDYVRAKNLTPQQQAPVRIAYERYQTTMAVAEASVAAANTSTNGQATINTALIALEKAAKEIATQIETAKKGTP